MQLNYQQQGQGFSVLLIHGLFGSLSNLGLLAKHLQQLGYRVISVDTLNHGHSPRSTTMDYRQQADTIKSLCDDLAISQCALVGHSMGGKIAMATAQAYPELVKALVVADIAPVSYQHSHQAVFAGLNNVQLTQISSRADADTQLSAHVQEPGVRQFLLKSLTKTSQGWAWLFDISKLEQAYSQIVDWKAGAAFNKPCLFIKGEQSDYITSQYQAAVTAQFPQAQLKIINGTGHWLHAEKPALFNRLTEQFLAKHI
ncbi:alpha/beta fold hydrolase [Agarivorans sp.]|uniref:alpha/beta fold hydrolase n=1 Tax=Agarivorans sp. TaxID=1872412 RepID=UPI003CFD1C8F